LHACLSCRRNRTGNWSNRVSQVTAKVSCNLIKAKKIGIWPTPAGEAPVRSVQTLATSCTGLGFLPYEGTSQEAFPNTFEAQARRSSRDGQERSELECTAMCISCENGNSIVRHVATAALVFFAVATVALGQNQPTFRDPYSPKWVRTNPERTYGLEHSSAVLSPGIHQGRQPATSSLNQHLTTLENEMRKTQRPAKAPKTPVAKGDDSKAEKNRSSGINFSQRPGRKGRSDSTHALHTSHRAGSL